METKFKLTNNYKLISLAMIIIGIVSVAISIIQGGDRLWPNLLLNNYYFLSLAIGASFFMAIQYITQSGWSAMFKRVPEAMSAFVPVAFILMLVLFAGLHDIFHWTHSEAVAQDSLLQHKQPYLNIPFFSVRFAVFFGAWIVMTLILRKYSAKEDNEGGMENFRKSEFYSKIYIFILAISFTFFTFDWIMSIDSHWYSTIFSVKGFIAAFYHGTAVMVLIIILLNKKGYFPDLSKSHLLDFSRYVFMLAIVWGYLTFSEFMLIWYGNIPEETIYFAQRFEMGYKTLFYVNFVINWFVPFIILMSRHLDKNRNAIIAVLLILIAGNWIDLYVQIMPGTVGNAAFGLVEVGTFVGFAGLFMLVFGYNLSKKNLIPRNHPYLEESLYHHVDQ